VTGADPGLPLLPRCQTPKRHHLESHQLAKARIGRTLRGHVTSAAVIYSFCPSASGIHSTYIIQPVNRFYSRKPVVIAKFNRITTEITTDLDGHF
jgi:hypothetical protein